MFGLNGTKTVAVDPDSGQSKPVSGQQAAAISDASTQVKSKRGGFRPGAGRKPGGGTASVGTPSSNGKEPVEIAPSEADIEFVKTIAEAGLKILDRVESNMIEGVISSIGDKYISERKDAYLKQREIGPGDIEIVVNAAGAIAAKYSVLTRYAPEAALLSWAAIHGMAFSGVLGDLRKLAKIVKESKTKGVSEDARSSPTN